MKYKIKRHTDKYSFLVEEDEKYLWGSEENAVHLSKNVAKEIKASMAFETEIQPVKVAPLKSMIYYQIETKFPHQSKWTRNFKKCKKISIAEKHAEWFQKSAKTRIIKIEITETILTEQAGAGDCSDKALATPDP